MDRKLVSELTQNLRSLSKEMDKVVFATDGTEAEPPAKLHELNAESDANWQKLSQLLQTKRATS